MRESSALQFLVIGAQKAGTTTLWRLLRDHPRVWLPAAKEAPFFSHTEEFERGVQDYLERLRAPSGEDVVRGTVTPHYMQGWRDAPSRVVAERIARTLPAVRLVALLRDPVARARSQHAMAVARGQERRDADRALDESLRPEALRAGRRSPDDTNSYVVQGEYGRILNEYLRFFPRAALHVALSDSLEREPQEVVRRILRFIGAGEDLDAAGEARGSDVALERAFPGGRVPRVRDGDLLALLRAIGAARAGEGRSAAGVLAERAAIDSWLAAQRLDARGLEEFKQITDRYLEAPPERWYTERVGLEFTLRKIWNVVPSAPEPVSDRVLGELRAHFDGDAPALAAATGMEAPWCVPA